MKGTGINGLQGIHPKDAGIGGKITRPLLFARKAELITFAIEHQLKWREDSSNDTSKYTRNFYRNELLPAIRKIHPQVDNNLLHNIDRFKEVKELYDFAINKIISTLIIKVGENIHVPVLKLLKQTAVKSILYELFTPFGFSSNQMDEIEKICHAESGKYILSDSHRILKNRNWLIVTKKNTTKNEWVILNENDTEARFDNVKIILSKSAVLEKLHVNNSTALINAAEIKYPLLLRKWKQGDYFYPLGMKKKKKLSRFFIDKKLSLQEKEQVLVLESNKKIVWVVGLRIDDRFKITPSTHHVLKLTVAK
jgi:tRNA(Ile)-lysidine synthase